ncbi:MAG: hypothetical protein BWX95_01941 [Bacteroidetes bacterium ADurb.Bin141]|nr:MAG: hypothetical protein BWX95_01941 [Bacteroidetes bacterium ADurb.Bin141]
MPGVYVESLVPILVHGPNALVVDCCHCIFPLLPDKVSVGVPETHNVIGEGVIAPATTTEVLVAAAIASFVLLPSLAIVVNALKV